jgi:uncharacterized protein DUF3800
MWIQRLGSGVPTSKKKAWCFVVLQVFIDESGRGQEEEPAFILAGYFARVRSWEAFADKWQEVLSEAPSIKYLKASEAYSLSRQFKGWSREQRDARLLKFASLIRKSVAGSVTLAVNGIEFNRILKASKGALKNVYPLAVAATVAVVLRSALTSRTRERLEFIFDEGMLNAKLFEVAFDDMMISLPRKATDLIGRRPRMENDKLFVPLQAADLLAWHVRNDWQHPHVEAVSVVREHLRQVPTLDASPGLNQRSLQELRIAFERELSSEGGRLARWR